MIRIDAHQHFWDPTRGDYGWLKPTDTRLYRPFGPEMLRPLLDAAKVEQTILVQAAATEAETQYLLQLANTHSFVAGVVGWVDFEAQDVGSRIDALVASCGGKLKGLRPMIQDILDPNWIAHPRLDAAFQAMMENDLVFDALVTPLHLGVLRQRLLKHANLKAVLDHAGKPDISGGHFESWAANLELLANDTSLHCKLSGLLSVAAAGAGVRDLDEYVAHIFACFGADRVLWGSDWPVLTACAEYSVWFELARELVRRHAPGSAEKVFGANAARLYALDTSG